jgi:alcohol dehydrogenase
MKMRAAVLDKMGATPPYAVSKPLTVTTVDLASPGHGEVLIRIAAAGLCHSDLSVINGDRPRPMPMALGHEGRRHRRRARRGSDGPHDRRSRRSGLRSELWPLRTRAEGRPALCEPGAAANGAGTLLSGARRLARGAEPLNHHLGCSVFAEYATVSRHSVVKIDPTVPLDEAALFGCAVLTGVGAVVNTAKVSVGASVAVVGLGGVGLAALIGARAAGARQIIAVDLSDDKLQQAITLGATHVVNAGQPMRSSRSVAELRRRRIRLRVRRLDSRARAAYRITRRGGCTVTAGLPPSTAVLPLPAVSLVAEERTLKGSYIGTCVPSRDIPRYIDLYSQGRLPVNKLLTGRLRLDDINHGFDLLHEGKAIRQVVVFE